LENEGEGVTGSWDCRVLRMERVATCQQWIHIQSRLLLNAWMGYRPLSCTVNCISDRAQKAAICLCILIYQRCQRFFPEVLKLIGIFSEHSNWFNCRGRPSGPYRRPSGASAWDRAMRLLLWGQWITTGTDIIWRMWNKMYKISRYTNAVTLRVVESTSQWVSGTAGQLASKCL